LVAHYQAEPSGYSYRLPGRSVLRIGAIVLLEKNPVWKNRFQAQDDAKRSAMLLHVVAGIPEKRQPGHYSQYAQTLFGKGEINGESGKVGSHFCLENRKRIGKRIPLFIRGFRKR
jgi:hypothetical protein